MGTAAQATVVIADDDAGISVADDLVRTGKNIKVLTVNGTPGDDEIIIEPQGSSVVVKLNGQVLGTPTLSKGLYRIVVFGGAGDDQIRLNSKLKFSAELHGESGNDLLIGSKGRDLLIGGDGVDSLNGRGGEDILIGGLSDYTANPTATATLLNNFLGKGTFATRARPSRPPASAPSSSRPTRSMMTTTGTISPAKARPT